MDEYLFMTLRKPCQNVVPC